MLARQKSFRLGKAGGVIRHAAARDPKGFNFSQ
jgi:hypothetical protein